MKTIIDIGQELNALVQSLPIARLQELRRATKGIGGYETNILFSRRDYKDTWTFHHGGRNEFQFNIAEELQANGRKRFRYGLALSFEPTQYLREPLAQLSRQMRRLNELVNARSVLLQGLTMSIHKGAGDDRAGVDLPEPRQHDPVLRDFVFVGRYISKGIDELSETDLQLVAKGLSDMLPLYEEVELKTWQPEAQQEVAAEECTARVCFNTNAWQSPSGLVGKSHAVDSHERQYGFGFEEWLFDLDKTIGGYHYAHLTPIRNAKDERLRRPLNLSLYTRNADSHDWFWVGRIENAEAISQGEAQVTWSEYKERGWLEEMQQELEEHAEPGAAAYFLEHAANPNNAFNVRFRPENVHQYEPPGIPFSAQVDTERIKHYQLYGTIEDVGINEGRAAREFEPNGPPEDGELPRIVKKTYGDGAYENDALHEPLKNAFHRYLNGRFPGVTEGEAGFTKSRASVDLKFRNADGRFTYFEVKTYSRPMLSVRMAIGQLLEYAYFHGDDIINELVIVSHLKPTIGLDDYLRAIQRKTGLRVGYIWFDKDEREVKALVNCQEY